MILPFKNCNFGCYWVSGKKKTGLVGPSDLNLVLMANHYSSIVNLNIDCAFVDIGAFSVEILTLKTQIFLSRPKLWRLA